MEEIVFYTEILDILSHRMTNDGQAQCHTQVKSKGKEKKYLPHRPSCVFIMNQ